MLLCSKYADGLSNGRSYPKVRSWIPWNPLKTHIHYCGWNRLGICVPWRDVVQLYYLGNCQGVSNKYSPFLVFPRQLLCRRITNEQMAFETERNNHHLFTHKLLIDYFFNYFVEIKIELSWGPRYFTEFRWVLSMSETSVFLSVASQKPHGKYQI